MDTPYTAEAAAAASAALEEEAAAAAAASAAGTEPLNFDDDDQSNDNNTAGAARPVDPETQVRTCCGKSFLTFAGFQLLSPIQYPDISPPPLVVVP